MRVISWLLFFCFLLSGCVHSQESASGELEERGEQEFGWEHTLTNTTLLVKVNSNKTWTLGKQVREVPDTNTWTSAASIVGGPRHFDARLDNYWTIRVNDHTAPLVEPTDPAPVPPMEWLLNPGTTYVVLESKGITTTFNITGSQGSLDVLNDDPTMSRFITTLDDGWDSLARFHVPSFHIHHGTLDLEPMHEHVEARVFWSAQDYRVSLGGCTMTGPSVWPEMMHVGITEPDTLEVYLVGAWGNPLLVAHLLDLPIDIALEVVC